MKALTDKQRKRIERLAERRRNGEHITLYRAQSISGMSETMRYRRRWLDDTPWGRKPRSESHIVFSVTFNVLPDGRDDPASWAEYNAKCEEAEALFDKLT